MPYVERMKTCSNIPPLTPAKAGAYHYIDQSVLKKRGGRCETYHFIDTAPLVARYEVLAASILAMVMAGRLKDSLLAAHKIIRLLRALTRSEAHNVHLKRKLDMLIHKPWRERVLKELGGMRKLRLWEAAQKRSEARGHNPATTPTESDPSLSPAWLYTAECIAESERLKERARMCGRATAHPNIVRDRYKMDFEGEFRLAPLPRGERVGQQMRVYTQNTIIDYEWNNIPFAKERGFGPAAVWPTEFRAAMALELEEPKPQHRHTDANDVRPIPMSESGDQLKFDALLKQQGMGLGYHFVVRRDDKIECSSLPKLPLHVALPPAVYRDLFETPI